MIPVRVENLGTNPDTPGIACILRDEESDQLLPIFIGSSEAKSIALQMEDAEIPRPLTHDLMVSILRSMDASVERVEVTRLEENTFFAEITIRRVDNEVTVLDARPSDGIALAMRTGADIYVAEEVLEEAGVYPDEAQPQSEEAREIARLQEELQDAVENEQFEKAADLRDRIGELQSQIRKQEESMELEEDLTEELTDDFDDEPHEEKPNEE